MKKYRIIDEDGEKYEVEELDVTADPVEEPTTDEDVVLTVEEIGAIRKLIPYIDTILAMVGTDETTDAVEEVTEEEEVEDSERCDEEIVETKEMTRDSKKSFGALERNKNVVDDSVDDEVSAAWAKRFNGGK